MIDIDKYISESIKDHDLVKANVFRNIKNEILKFKTAKNAKEYDDNAEINILTKLVSQYNDSIEQFKKANRNDLVEKETAELNIVSELLPKEASEQDIINAIFEACKIEGIDNNVNYVEFIPKNKFGLIMKFIKNKFPQNNGSQIVPILKTYLIK